MKKTYVRLLLVLFVSLLAIEYKLSMAGIEPYPAIVYPEFSYLLPQEGSIPVNKPDFVVTFENGTTEKLDYYELFSNVPISHINHLVVLNLNPDSRVRPEKFQNKKMRSFQLGRYTVEWRHTPNSYSQAEIAERDSFLRNRIEYLTGRTDADFLHITWYEYDFVFGVGRDFENRRKRYEAIFNLAGEEDT